MDDVEILPVGGDFVARHWTEISEAFFQMSVKETGIEPPLAHMNGLLQAFTTGTMKLWVAVGEKTVYGMFATSKYVGGPPMGWVLYLTYVIGLDGIPLPVWKRTIVRLQKYMQSEGCSMLIAHTQNDKIKQIGEMLGAESDVRLTWRL